MEVSPLILLLKSLFPAFKELILGKHTLKEALAENVVASTLLAGMIVMLLVTMYISDLAASRYSEILRLREEVSTLNREMDEVRLNIIGTTFPPDVGPTTQLPEESDVVIVTPPLEDTVVNKPEPIAAPPEIKEIKDNHPPQRKKPTGLNEHANKLLHRLSR